MKHALAGLAAAWLQNLNIAVFGYGNPCPVSRPYQFILTPVYRLNAFSSGNNLP